MQIQEFFNTKIFKYFIIGNNNKRFRLSEANELRAPNIQYSYNNEKFFIVNKVIIFNLLYNFKIVGDGILFLNIFLELRKYSYNNTVVNIYFDSYFYIVFKIF